MTGTNISNNTTLLKTILLHFNYLYNFIPFERNKGLQIYVITGTVYYQKN